MTEERVPDPEKFKKLLEKRRDEILRDVHQSGEGRSPVELDQTKVGRLSRMDAMQGQAMALAVEERRKNELMRIENALNRIASEDYGFCLSCDEEIAIKRLELDPAVPTCIACANKQS